LPLVVLTANLSHFDTEVVEPSVSHPPFFFPLLTRTNCLGVEDGIILLAFGAACSVEEGLFQGGVLVFFREGTVLLFGFHSGSLSYVVWYEIDGLSGSSVEMICSPTACSLCHWFQ